MKTKNHRKNKINVVTLGCSKNVVDSEILMGQLSANGFEVSHDADGDEAKVVIINTCGFIENAKQESINTILQYASAKEDGRIDELYVTGCLSQRYKPELEKEIGNVDAWFGTQHLPQLLKKLGADYKHELIGERFLTTPSHFAYMKISEGCNRTCSFCAIPLMRGKHISKSIEDILTEAKSLAAKGVKELILIAQELTYYGLDLYKERRLNELLNRLCEIEGIEWIRLHYAYPSKFPIEILEVMRDQPKICNYLDLPLQHISDSVLTAMHRQTTKNYIEDLIREIRETVPGISLRTTMLVGFPGETENDFHELIEFVERTKFDRLGVFTYSHEENTTAFELEDDVPKKLKSERASRLMEVQQKISFEKNQQKVGQELRVLIDRKEGKNFVGRTEYDSPEVDNEVLINGEKNYLRIGDFAEVKIIDADDFDLYAELV